MFCNMDKYIICKYNKFGLNNNICILIDLTKTTIINSDDNASGT